MPGSLVLVFTVSIVYMYGQINLFWMCLGFWHLLLVGMSEHYPWIFKFVDPYSENSLSWGLREPFPHLCPSAPPARSALSQVTTALHCIFTTLAALQPNAPPRMGQGRMKTWDLLDRSCNICLFAEVVPRVRGVRLAVRGTFWQLPAWAQKVWLLSF